MEPRYTCGEPLKCPEDFEPGLLGYIVILPPKHQKPGIYPLGDGPTPDSPAVQVIAFFMEEQCGLHSFVIASDGVVEVLAIDSECVALDIRGVTTAPEGLDPNGSGRAPLCKPSDL